jgi:hypothetical protein
MFGKLLGFGRMHENIFFVFEIGFLFLKILMKIRYFVPGLYLIV